ncbi:MAG: vitamin K epoxide reductase family protein [Chloroflexi bacterium]|nr:vitamin K epoxide reductase family protein [Chloroflexota bacterium]
MRALSQPKSLQVLGALLSAAGLGISLYLFYSKISKSSIICTPGSECDVVNASAYSMLLGVPVSAIGAVGYLAMLVLAVWAFAKQADAPMWLPNVRLVLASGGLFFAAYLTVIEAFVLHAYCIWCVTQAIAMLGIFVALLFERRFETA